MKTFVAKSKAELKAESKETQPLETEANSLKVKKKALHQQEQLLRHERRIIREQRSPEDAAWKQLKTKRQKQKDKAPKQSPKKS